jgi:hypothetical protein
MSVFSEHIVFIIFNNDSVSMRVWPFHLLVCFTMPVWQFLHLRQSMNGADSVQAVIAIRDPHPSRDSEVYPDYQLYAPVFAEGY